MSLQNLESCPARANSQVGKSVIFNAIGLK